MRNHYELYFGDIVSGGESEDGRFDVPVADMLTKILARPGGDSGLLPPVVKAFSEDMKFFIVERPPTKVSIRAKLYINEDGEQEEFDFEIALPWMVYLLNFSEKAHDLEDDEAEFSLMAFARPEQIFSEMDELYLLPLPNIAHNGEVCFGNAAHGMEFNEDDDLTSKINMVINCMWASPANEDFNAFVLSPIEEFKELLGKPGETDTSIGEKIRLYLDAWSRLGINDVLGLSFYNVKAHQIDYREKVTKDNLTVGKLIEYMEHAASAGSNTAKKYYPGILYNELAAQAAKN